MENRVNLGKAAPELYQSIVNLDRLASELAVFDRRSLDKVLFHTDRKHRPDIQYSGSIKL